ncbi:MAG: pyridoxal-phosphate dependent enzyme, partial [Candidatus Rokuibacteriota bacterium]
MIVGPGPSGEDVADPVHRDGAADLGAPGGEEIAHRFVGVGERQAAQAPGLAGPDLPRAHDGRPEAAGVDGERGVGDRHAPHHAPGGSATLAGVRYVDPSTGRTYPLSEARWRGDSGHYLNLTPGPGLRRADIETSRYSVWRYAKALPVPVEDAVSLGEGWTPLVAGEWDAVPVRYKLEFTMPTGSFKDRGTTVMVSYLRSRGIQRVLEDSSGNAGASLSAYAAAAGMACRILVPETASYPKVAQIAACGADVVTIKGSRQDVAEAALRQSAEIFYASHNWQPCFVEGIKTLAYELWE